MLEGLKNIPWEFTKALLEMSPYLLLGFAAAGLMSVLLPEPWVQRHLGGRRFSAVWKAAALGVPLPLCSCSVIPVAASLRRHGAGRGATLSFLISTPQTGVDSILVTYGMLGPIFTIFRPILALISGVAGGVAVLLWGGKEPPAESPPAASGAPARAPGGKSWLHRAIGYGFVTLPEDIGKAVVLGLLIAAFISALVPSHYFTDRVAPGPPQIALLMLIGIPVYVCATASVPIAAALIAAGVSPGAALAFLITGPGTNAATIATIWKLMGRKTTLLYLLTIAVAAFGGGMLLDFLFHWLRDLPISVIPSAHHMHDMGQVAWWEWASAAILVATLGTGFVRPLVLRRQIQAAPAPDSPAITLAVEGMTCNHCRQTVRGAILAVPGVEEAEVDLEGRRALVRGIDVDIDLLCQAVRDAGYQAQPVPAQSTGTKRNM